MKETYEIYVEKHGKIQSGHTLTDTDFFDTDSDIGFDEAGKIAVSLAAQDVLNEKDLRSRSEFKKELERLLS